MESSDPPVTICSLAVVGRRRPGRRQRCHHRSVDEGTTHRISFSVLPTDGGGSDFQVCVHVDGVELTSTAAGLGMDPRDLLVGGAGLGATPEPRTPSIARCTCGIYGCGSTDVTIMREATSSTGTGRRRSHERLPSASTSLADHAPPSTPCSTTSRRPGSPRTTPGRRPASPPTASSSASWSEGPASPRRRWLSPPDANSPSVRI